MLIQHISNNDKIFIQVDSDCDGFTSAACLINYLYYIFPNYTKNNIIYNIHQGKEHGLYPDKIPEDVKLIIAPDSSSNNFLEHEYLHTVKNIDILVIDHHEAEKVSEYACVVNNQLCDYPTKSLSGVGMVYKFCSYIDNLLNLSYSDNLLDLVALGMIADMMDLRDYETKRLIEKGLSQIINPFFYTMYQKNKKMIGEEITPIGIAFYIAPYVNATIRTGTQEEKYTLFESMINYKGYEMIPSTKRGCSGQEENRCEQACRNCINVKNRQKKIQEKDLSEIEKIIKEKSLLENKILIVKLPEELQINRNLVGLIANQLMAKYNRPVLLLNKNVIENKNNNDTDWQKWLNKKINQDNKNVGKIIWEGSGRGCDKSKLNNFKEFLQTSNLVEYAEGHANAFGCGVLDENFLKLVDYCNKILKDYEFNPIYKVDFVYTIENVSSQDILDIANLKNIWGQGLPEAFVVLSNIKVNASNLKLMSPDKNPTLKITLPNGISLIKFKSSQEEYDNLYSEYGYLTINIVGKCEKNVWNNIVSPQIIVEDYEIVSQQKYYF